MKKVALYDWNMHIRHSREHPVLFVLWKLIQN